MQVLKRISNHILIFLIVIYAAIFISAQISTHEYKVKAAFLFNFTQFVEWPSQSFSTDNSPFVIGVLGTDPFGNSLEELVSGETIKNHPIVIQHFNSLEEIGNCHILFVNLQDKNKLQSIPEKLKGKNILTVSDANGFSKLGGMIRLYTKNDKINIQVNLEATKAENLIVSSKLLKLAEIVKTDKK